MLDKKTTEVLRVLAKLCDDNAYKVVTVEEILTVLSSKSYDNDSVKETIDFLSKQEYIVIKFEEDWTICYSLLPKARIYLENELQKHKTKNKNSYAGWILLSGLISGFVASLVFIIFYYFLI